MSVLASPPTCSDSPTMNAKYVAGTITSPLVQSRIGAFASDGRGVAAEVVGIGVVSPRSMLHSKIILL